MFQTFWDWRRQLSYLAGHHENFILEYPGIGKPQYIRGLAKAYSKFSFFGGFSHRDSSLGKMG
ncbi:hypothetical protein PanWU01x14_101630 [Parasponia andersonii]|uniref:Uncharacterized protein n=1 Tax=Parasponia andersonii TaxID=3476 RepID=A0A2P5D369_PARAD|nr:hypothetical protein PanWU01x14_101630 [Parasponia andersonii]